MQIRKTDQFWGWLRNTLIPGLRADEWYNGRPPVGQRGFSSDRVSRMMGYATIRQLRVKPRKCNSLQPHLPDFMDIVEEKGCPIYRYLVQELMHRIMQVLRRHLISLSNRFMQTDRHYGGHC